MSELCKYKLVINTHIFFLKGAAVPIASVVTRAVNKSKHVLNSEKLK